MDFRSVPGLGLPAPRVTEPEADVGTIWEAAMDSILWKPRLYAFILRGSLTSPAYRASAPHQNGLKSFETVA